MTDVVEMSGGALAEMVAHDGDPRPALMSAPMSRAQKLGVFTTLLISAMDGYDILAASFAAPNVTREWGLSHSAVGMILAVNLVGLAIGSMFISPVADRIGRRMTVLPCLLLTAGIMFVSAGANGPQALAVMRLLAGLSIGGMIGATLSLATEYANVRNRPLTAAVMSIGLPLGGLVGGATAAVLLRDHSWRSIFVAGGVMTLAVGAIAAWLLPESLDGLIGRGGDKNLAAVNRVLRRFEQPAVTVLPAARARPAAGGRGPAIFGPELRGTTAAMAAVNFCQMMTIFFFVSWLPQIVADLGFTSSAAATVAIFQNSLGIVGAFAIGWLARRTPIVPLAAAMMAGTALSILLFAFLPREGGLLRLGAALEGFMALGCSAGIYGVMAQAFPAAARSTGTGFSYAFGRLGSIVAAVVPGVLFTRGWSLAGVSAAMGVVSLAAIAVLLVWDGRVRALSQSRSDGLKPV